MKIIGVFVLTDSVFTDKINKAMKIFIVFAKTAENTIKIVLSSSILTYFKRFFNYSDEFVQLFTQWYNPLTFTGARV
jgi:hypothetical protein